MKKIFFLITIALSIAFTSCELLEDVKDNLPNELTTDEVVEGLKKALVVGSDSASSTLGITNGYYGDATNSALRILLPSEADVILNNISVIPGGDQLIANVILGINRAAEDAAKDVVPIFVNAITDMSIADGWEILNGENDAATTYLNATTRPALVNLYAPKISTSLSNDLGLGFTAQGAWDQLTSLWNSYANSLLNFSNHQTVNTDLGEYLTDKALDGLFIKVAEEEKEIRDNPYQYVTPILEKVFGAE